MLEAKQVGDLACTLAGLNHVALVASLFGAPLNPLPLSAEQQRAAMIVDILRRLKKTG